MIHNFPYLNDSKFLYDFDKQKTKEQYVKINILNFQTEDMVKAIETQVISGNINIDGTSAMRRTANLSLVAKDSKYSQFDIKKLLTLNKKVQILIGFKNTTNKYKEFPILWFPQGIFVIIDLNISQGTGGISINLTLHDKIALLNGECGGVFPATVVFHEMESIDQNGKPCIINPTIFQIIKELVNHFGGQDLAKIIISDLNERIKQPLKWTGSNPIYLGRKLNINSHKYQNIYSTNYNSLINELGNSSFITEYSYGEDIGYIYTDFIYPGELIGNAGENIVDILEKIKTFLGNFEYFYDINGNFRFQQIKNNLNTTYTKNLIDSLNQNNYLVDYTNGRVAYIFNDSNIIQSYTNNPQFQQIKNDFIIWGKRKNINGVEIPIRYHLAIDHKPSLGNIYEVCFYIDETDKLTKIAPIITFQNFNNFPTPGLHGIYYFARRGKNNRINEIYLWDQETEQYILQNNCEKKSIKAIDYRTEYFLQGINAEKTGSEKNYYYTELKNQWTKIYDIENRKFFDQVVKYPNGIDFFLDILDTSSELSEFNINNIGRRTLVINDETINCIFEPNIPDIILIESGTNKTQKLREECQNQNQDYFQMETNMYSLLTNGGILKSAYEQIRAQLYKYTNYNQRISLTTLPIYYLEPNTRITIYNPEVNIQGDYMITSISLPLTIDGTMNISCIKILEKI